MHEPEPLEDKQIQPDMPEKPPARIRSGIFIAILALIIGLIGLGIEFFSWQQYQKTQSQVLSENQELESHIQPAIHSLLEQIMQQQKSINTLLNQNSAEGHKKALFVLDEAKHLVTLSQYNLLFDNNIDLAVRLLNDADQKLQEMNDPGVNPIRKELSNAIIALNTMQKVDVTGLASKIAAISNQVSDMNFIPIVSTQPNTTMTAQRHLTWKEKFMATLQRLRGIISIRRLKEPVQPWPSQENQAYVLENIRLQLSQAQWAVLHQNPVLYQMGLENAKTELQKYVGRTATGVSLIQLISELQQINIKPKMLDLSNIITLLQNYSANTQQTLTNPAIKTPGAAATPGTVPTTSPLPRALPS